MRALTPLVMRFGAMGDMVLLIPMLKALQQRYGQPCELVSSGPWTPPLMQRVPACGPVHLLTSRRAPYFFNRSQWLLVDALRRRPTGPVYVFEPDDKPLSLLKRAGIKPEWICSLRDLPGAPREHVASRALRLARETPSALIGRSDYEFDDDYSVTHDARPTLRESDRRDCKEWIARRGAAGAPLVLLQPGNKKTMKGGDRRRDSNVDYWPEAYWAEVISGVQQLLPGARVVICGAPSERQLAEDIVTLVSSARNRVIIATDDLPIPRLLALQECAHSLISVNTGPAHSAAAMGCPEIVMFTRHAHRAADLYAPLSTTAPVEILQPDSLNPDARLASITPDTVINAWHQMTMGFWQQRNREELGQRENLHSVAR